MEILYCRNSLSPLPLFSLFTPATDDGMKKSFRNIWQKLNFLLIQYSISIMKNRFHQHYACFSHVIFSLIVRIDKLIENLKSFLMAIYFAIDCDSDWCRVYGLVLFSLSFFPFFSLLFRSFSSLFFSSLFPLFFPFSFFCFFLSRFISSLFPSSFFPFLVLFFSSSYFPYLSQTYYGKFAQNKTKPYIWTKSTILPQYVCCKCCLFSCS